MEILGSDGIAAVFCLCFIGADYLSGVIRALKNKELCSTKMRLGLWHKAGFIGAMALGYGCQLAANYDLLPTSFNAVFGGVCVYVIITEAISIFENLCVLSPELRNSPLAALLKLKDEKNDD
jgi:toxin secretion/phage lysis holin|nr:MAG TPA: holin [Caudoviricetes sp.]